MSVEFKREWHYQVFDNCGDFESWQAECDYERNIESIVPLHKCPCGQGTQQRVLVTWWISPPGNTGGHGCTPQEES